MRLTPAACRSAPIGSVLKDDEVAGLQLRVNQTRRTWYLYYRGRDGQQRRPSLGTFPTMSLQDARNAARALRQQIALGADPSAEWQAQRAEATVDELCDRYLEHCAGRVAQSSLAQYASVIDPHIRPAWGRRRVSSVTLDDCNRLLRRVEQTSGPGAANHLRTQIRAIWNRATDTFRILPKGHENPADRSHIAHEMQRTRHATPEELSRIFAFLANAPAEKAPYVAAMMALFLTGCRVGEIQNATVADWRGDRFEFAQHKTVRHTGAVKVHYVHPSAAAMIDALPSARGKPSDRLFGRILLRNFWRRLRKAVGCEDLRLQDARRTFASYGISDAASLDSVAQLLGHTDQRTTRRYAHLIQDTRRALSHDIAERLLDHAPKSPKG